MVQLNQKVVVDKNCWVYACAIHSLPIDVYNRFAGRLT
jgi:hypothetical protein